jgi:PPOX class probable FMN-dependent enzyme
MRIDGRPANRTLVFRGFLEETDQLKFVVDARSQKTEQINQCSWGEACWYFTETREQFRISGCLTLVGADHPDAALRQARQATWQDLSDNTRLQFAWPHPSKNRADMSAFTLPAPDPDIASPNFCLLLLEPTQVDHLELQGEPQNRWIYSFDDSCWSTQAVNP